MTHRLKTKDSFEAMDYAEKAGILNKYICKECGLAIIYSYIASGITPVKINCTKCKGTMWSQDSEDIPQPDRIWYRPDGIFELERLALAAFASGLKKKIYKEKNGEKMIALILTDYVNHYNGGGLFAKILKE